MPQAPKEHILKSLLHNVFIAKVLGHSRSRIRAELRQKLQAPGFITRQKKQKISPDKRRHTWRNRWHFAARLCYADAKVPTYGNTFSKGLYMVTFLLSTFPSMMDWLDSTARCLRGNNYLWYEHIVELGNGVLHYERLTPAWVAENHDFYERLGHAVISS